MPISFHYLELLLFSDFQGRIIIRRKTKPILIYVTRCFSILGKPWQRLLSYLRVYLQNITLLSVASYSGQQLIAVVTHLLFHYPQLWYSIYSLSIVRLGNLRGHFVYGVFMKLQICAQLLATTCSCHCYLSCFLYNHILPPSSQNKKKSKTISVYALTKG